MEKSYATPLQKEVMPLCVIQQVLSITVFPRIIGEMTAKNAWEILQEEFQGSVKLRNIRHQTLSREFENFKLKIYETVQECCGRLKELVNQMRAYGDEIAYQRVVEKILVTTSTPSPGSLVAGVIFITSRARRRLVFSIFSLRA